LWVLTRFVINNKKVLGILIYQKIQLYRSEHIISV